MRRQLLVDPKVQGALLFRVVVYWFLSLFVLAMLLLDWRIVSSPGLPLATHLHDMWYWYGPVVAIATLILLPITLLDSARLSNRFAGPMYRLHRELRRAIAGQRVPPVMFREGDFWHDFADDFNILVEQVQRLTIQLRHAQGGLELPEGDFPAGKNVSGDWPPIQLGVSAPVEATTADEVLGQTAEAGGLLCGPDRFSQG